MRRGARRFDSQTTVTGLDHVGVENPDGQRVLVLSNSAGERKVTLQMGGMSADVNLKSDSVTTLLWA
jgi:O-glycosyl hydrolase